MEKNITSKDINWNSIASALCGDELNEDQKKDVEKFKQGVDQADNK